MTPNPTSTRLVQWRCRGWPSFALFAKLGTHTLDLGARTFTTAYTYDAPSNRKTLTDPENGLTTYGYDNLNRLNALQDFQLAPLRDLRMHPEVFLGPAHHLAFAPVAELAHDFRQGQPQCALYLDPHLGRNIINFS